MVKIWVDDEREMPDGYDYHSFTVDNAIALIKNAYHFNDMLEVSLDHDAGDYVCDGGDYINILEYLEENCFVDSTWSNYVKDNITFHLYTANRVGRDNMRRIIQKNGWREV